MVAVMKNLYAVGGTVLSTILLWIAALILHVDLVVDPKNGQPPGEIALPFAAAITLVVALLAWGLRALLDRLAPRRAARIWTIVAGVLLVLSFLPILAVGASGGTKAILALAHLAVAAILIPTLGRAPVRRYAEAA
jgi:4-amino-4-deoxy-L-arabinose transferase-like glycosyltransferase